MTEGVYLDYLIIILEVITILGILFLAMIKKDYFPSYLKAKAKNLATIEDVEKITKIVDDVKQDNKIRFDKIQKRNEVLIDEIKQSKDRFNSKQFELYNELWSSLIELKISANYLWESASAINLKRFSKNLHDTKIVIEKSSLLIEDKHFEQLMDIIKNFEEYEEGKVKLVQIRNKTIEEVRGLAYKFYIEGIIEKNEEAKVKFENLLDELKEQFKNIIRGESFNKSLERNILP